MMQSDVSEFTAFDRVSILSEALPYLQRFRGKTIVIKYGGAAMKDGSLKARVVSDLVLLATVGIRPVLVHGGGPEINIWLSKLGIEPNFKNGLRVTDGACFKLNACIHPTVVFFFNLIFVPGFASTCFRYSIYKVSNSMHGAGDTMDVVEMVLGARVNKSLVNLIQQAGGQAVGLCGKDNDTILARQMVEKEIGFVGEVTSVDPRLIEGLAMQGYIPVMASVASDGKGQALNVNADTAAGEIAAALKAEKLILMTDVPGVLHDKDDPSSIYAELSIRKCNELISDEIIAGGMIPKVDCCIRCLSQGVAATHIIDGRKPHSLLMELLTDEGVGTMIVG